MKDIAHTGLAELIPRSINQDSNIQASAEAIDVQLKALTSTLEYPALYYRLNALSSVALDHLAAGWDVEPWRESWPIEMKREVLKASAKVLSYRGTVAAVKAVIASLGSAAQIVEWWQTEPKGTPHTFSIQVNLSAIEGVLTDDIQSDMMKLIDIAKPARSHYELIINAGLNSTTEAIADIGQTVYARISDI